VAVAALGYAGYQFYQNIVLLRDTILAARGEDFDGPMLEYWLPLGLHRCADYLNEGSGLF
jgi:hypothetical protein